MGLVRDVELLIPCTIDGRYLIIYQGAVVDTHMSAVLHPIGCASVELLLTWVSIPGGRYSEPTRKQVHGWVLSKQIDLLVTCTIGARTDTQALR